jgi:DNA replication protein DnaC
VKAKASQAIDPIVDELMAIGMKKTASTLNELYNTPAFLEIDRVELLSKLIEPEYHAFINRRYTSRLKSAHLSGCPQEINNCVDSADRIYAPEGVVKTLSTGNYIRNGMNICILGASDSGKTYLAKAMGIAACTEFSVEYYCTEELIEQLSDIKELDLAKYNKHKKHLCKIDLLILDDFLLHSITDERQVKVLHELLNKRAEAFKSTIVCSQRMPKNWKVMILNDEIAADAIEKRATKHYTVMIESKNNE